MQRRPPIYISAPIAAIVEGILREDTTIATVKSKGDLGIGTFNDLDGEMVLVDGIVYRLRPDGEATIVEDDVQTPFACATRFIGDSEEHFAHPIAAEDFEARLLDLLPSRNLVYALRIEGRFSRLRARSVPVQHNYKPLAEIAKLQTVFDLADVSGTMVGFYTPSFLASVHVAGFHLHFISHDRKAGGHVLAAAPEDVVVRQQHCPTVELGLPMTLDFLTMERSRDLAADIKSAEREA